MKFFLAAFVSLFGASALVAQIPNAVPVDRTEQAQAAAPVRFSDEFFGFAIELPADWQIVGDEFEAAARERGIDLSLTPPETLSDVGRIRLERSLDRVRVLLTAVRNAEGQNAGAVVRVSVENLSAVPEVRDAVDYFDLMRSQFAAMRLPADMRYSETQAEALGKMQFAFLDVITNAGKKRMYATVRRRHAIMFTISYSDRRDLETLRSVLAGGDFRYGR